jgi:hypothetical protein
MLEGKGYLNNIVWANGEFPKPMDYVDAKTVFDIKFFLGLSLIL